MVTKTHLKVTFKVVDPCLTDRWVKEGKKHLAEKRSEVPHSSTWFYSDEHQTKKANLQQQQLCPNQNRQKCSVCVHLCCICSPPPSQMHLSDTMPHYQPTVIKPAALLHHWNPPVIDLNLCTDQVRPAWPQVTGPDLQDKGHSVGTPPLPHTDPSVGISVCLKPQIPERNQTTVSCWSGVTQWLIREDLLGACLSPPPSSAW